MVIVVPWQLHKPTANSKVLAQVIWASGYSRPQVR
jgi:hypothetical protein